MLSQGAGAQWKSVVFCPPTIHYSVSNGWMVGGQKTLFHWAPAFKITMLVSSVTTYCNLLSTAQ
jgi:hypothetical protein